MKNWGFRALSGLRAFGDLGVLGDLRLLGIQGALGDSREEAGGVGGLGVGVGMRGQAFLLHDALSTSKCTVLVMGVFRPSTTPKPQTLNPQP